MKIAVYFLLLILFSIIYNYISYIEIFRKSLWYLASAIVLSVIFAMIWFNLQKLVESKETVLFLVITWDVIVIIIGVVIPIIFFDIKISRLTYIGIIFIIIGIILLKITLLDKE